MTTDYCAQCGEPLKVLDHGARLQCCDGLAYWSPVNPTPDDVFNGQPQYKGHWLYQGKAWKPGMKRARAKPKLPTH